MEQIEFYIDNYAPTFPSSSSTDAHEQALLEAMFTFGSSTSFSAVVGGTLMTFAPAIGRGGPLADS